MSLRQRRTQQPNGKVVDSSPPDLVPEDGDDTKSTYEVDDSTSEKTKLLLPTPPIQFISPPSKLDNFLNTYNTFSGTTFYADQGIKILQWSSWAVSYLTQSNNKNNVLSPSMRKLYLDLSMTRYALRFYGFLQSLEGFRSGSWAGGTWDNPMIAKIAKYLMAGSMLVYYPLEHVAYAGWQMPNLVKVDANRYSAVSCRFWTAYIVGDFWVSCLKLKEMRKKLRDLQELLTGKKKTDDKVAIEEIHQEEQTLLNKIRHVKLQALRSVLFILPAINWSLPKWASDPLLSELTVNGLMLAESYTCVYQSLRAILG